MLRRTGGGCELGRFGGRTVGFRAFRPYFLGATAVFLVAGFWMLDREERAACEPGEVCADPAARRRMKVTLWAATILAVVLATFPSWQTLIF